MTFCRGSAKSFAGASRALTRTRGSVRTHSCPRRIAGTGLRRARRGLLKLLPRSAHMAQRADKSVNPYFYVSEGVRHVSAGRCPSAEAVLEMSLGIAVNGPEPRPPAGVGPAGGRRSMISRVLPS